MKKLIFAFLMTLCFEQQAQNLSITQIPENNTLKVSVSGKSQGVILFSELVGVPIVVNHDSYFVEKFSIVYMANEELIQLSVNGNMITANKIQFLRNNAKLFVENIIVRGIDGSVWRLSANMEFVVKM